MLKVLLNVIGVFEKILYSQYGGVVGTFNERGKKGSAKKKVLSKIVQDYRRVQKLIVKLKFRGKYN